MHCNQSELLSSLAEYVPNRLSPVDEDGPDGAMFEELGACSVVPLPPEAPDPFGRTKPASAAFKQLAFPDEPGAVN